MKEVKEIEEKVLKLSSTTIGQKLGISTRAAYILITVLEKSPLEALERLTLKVPERHLF